MPRQLSFNAKNVDLIYVLQHILYADYIYKKSCLPERATLADVEKYKTLCHKYIQNRLLSFNADILECKLTASKVEFTVKIYPSHIYKVSIDLFRFSSNMTITENNKKYEINPLTLDLKFEREVITREHKIYTPPPRKKEPPKPPPQPKAKPKKKRRGKKPRSIKSYY